MPILTPLYLSRLSLSLCRLHSEIHPCFSVFLFTLISRTPSPAVVLSPLWLGNISVPFISLNAVPLPPPPKILAHRAKVRPSIEPRLSLSLSSPLLSLSLPPLLRECVSQLYCHIAFSVWKSTPSCCKLACAPSPLPPILSLTPPAPVSDVPPYSVCPTPPRRPSRLLYVYLIQPPAKKALIYGEDTLYI